METTMQDFMSGNGYWLSLIVALVVGALWVDIKGMNE